MHERRRSVQTGLFLLLGLFAATSWAQEEERAAVGERVPDHEFQPLVGHDGRTRLSELFGQPVLLAGWKRHFAEGLDSASLADVYFRAYADDGLLLVLQDREVWDRQPPWLEDVDFWYRFYGTSVWFTESPRGKNDPRIVREASELDTQSFVLIGVDGRLVLEATIDIEDERAHKRQRKELKKAIVGELERRKRGWGDDPNARKARALAFGKGDLAGALRALDRLREEDRVPEHAAVREELARHFAARRRTVEFLLDEGRFKDGERALAQLARNVKGHAAFEEELAPLAQRLESEEGRDALNLDKKLARILAPFTERELKDLDLDFLRRVRAFAEEHAGSPVGERVRRLDPLLSRVVRILRKIKEKDFERKVSEG